MPTNLNLHKLELTLISTLLIISTFAHGINMFNYPYYENDEGVYMSRAWSIANIGELAPYIYWYDHAPVGSFLVLIWTKLSGGFYTFGNAINSGRFFMLLIHICSSGLIYYVTKKISNSIFAASIATIIFALSPLGIYFQIRVLLDNMMFLLFLISLSLLLITKKNLVQFS